MDNAAKKELVQQVLEDLDSRPQQCEIVQLQPGQPQRESLFENFVDEIDAWARRALASNGFGDY